jgi:hypothetical protein
LMPSQTDTARRTASLAAPATGDWRTHSSNRSPSHTWRAREARGCTRTGMRRRLLTSPTGVTLLLPRVPRPVIDSLRGAPAGSGMFGISDGSWLSPRRLARAIGHDSSLRLRAGPPSIGRQATAG